MVIKIGIIRGLRRPVAVFGVVGTIILTCYRTSTIFFSFGFKFFFDLVGFGKQGLYGFTYRVVCRLYHTLDGNHRGKGRFVSPVFGVDFGALCLIFVCWIALVASGGLEHWNWFLTRSEWFIVSFLGVIGKIATFATQGIRGIRGGSTSFGIAWGFIAGACTLAYALSGA